MPGKVMIINNIGTIFSILIATVGAYVSLRIALNDIKHIERTLKTMWTKIDEIKDHNTLQGERISKIEGKLELIEKRLNGH